MAFETESSAGALGEKRCGVLDSESSLSSANVLESTRFLGLPSSGPGVEVVSPALSSEISPMRFPKNKSGCSFCGILQVKSESDYPIIFRSATLVLTT